MLTDQLMDAVTHSAAANSLFCSSLLLRVVANRICLEERSKVHQSMNIWQILSLLLNHCPLSNTAGLGSNCGATLKKCTSAYWGASGSLPALQTISCFSGGLRVCHKTSASSELQYGNRFCFTGVNTWVRVNFK